MNMSYWAAPGQYTLNYIEQSKAIESTKYFSPERTEFIILAYFGLNMEDMLRKDRHQDIVYARHFLHYYLFTHSTMAKKAIGRKLKQDHTSVIHGINTIKDQLGMKANNKYKEDHYRIYLLLNAPVIHNA